jgi:ABC-2 type transport system permease protein
MRMSTQLVLHSAGRWLAITVPSLVVIGVLAWSVGVRISPQTGLDGALFAGSAALAVCLGVYLDIVLNLLVVLMDLPLWIVDGLRQALTALLSGALLPLAVLPDAVSRVLEFLPFASMASAPLTIYAGTNTHPARTIVVQLAWCLVATLAAAGAWRRAYERMQVHGG